ncbi:alpha/beta hydrolase [Defluviimonas sp. WL0024]|uniref:Alpha/beta hydrolase n=1 Tax=Albidovulum salinarum TaxID=2984153 RepID=A0ABT2WZI0_9RHOB|nr:alpha/beta hydrolase [Defluviimonas sp. WL0024]MCU9847086.1 alpha/beta hydrolase [Defluviimonas sp. WL0024]
MPTSFVLVHGGFGSPAELAPVVPYLEARGHRVVNVDLPCERAEATLEDYAATVARAMEGTGLPRVLVAHSAGGATTPLAASLLPVDQLIFVAAIVPEPGQSISEALGPDVAATILAVTIDNGDGTRSFNLDLLASLVPPEERAAYLEFLSNTQRRQGWLAINQPWPGGAIPTVPRNYILCTEDQIIPPDMQRAFAARLGVRPIEIASVHAAFTFKPRELADLLVSLAG